MHKQICVKVNALVDEHIACLITSLSAFDGVYTYESCEKSILGAYVCLHYGSPFEPVLTDTVQFADFLAKILDGTNCTVSVEWLTRPTVVLRLCPDEITSVASTLACHTTEYLRGKSGKVPGN